MRPGTRVGGRFVIEAQVGRGGMGVVYRARDESSAEPVAIKIVADGGDRFDREADLLARLAHPGIVRHIAHGRAESGEHFLAMQWLEGEDLQQRLGRGRLAIAEAVELARVLAQTLAEVHARGIVHRDVKPSNVWLADGRVDRPVLLDFGIARPLETWRLTATGHVVGTPQYMAPEQIQTPSDVDARADIYSLAAVAFECIAGRPAFVGDNAIAVLAKVLVEDAPALRDLVPDVPEPVQQVVRRALAKRREDRPSDVKALLAELDGVVVAAQPVTSVPRLGTDERRLVCVVIAEAGTVDATATPAQLTEELERATSIATVHDMRVLPVAGGYVAISTSSGVATDQARRAARYALTLAAQLPASAVALAIGWGTVGPVPVGEAIDRAAAMLAAGRAPGSGVRVDDVAAGLLEVGCELARDDAGHILLGERRAGERPRTLLGRATSCVGRDRELRALEDLFAEVRDDGLARAALVTAPAGGGKSRIRHELLARLARLDEPPRIAIAHAEMLRAGSPLDLLARCVRSLVGEHAEPEAALRAHVAPEVVDFLLEIVGAPRPPGASAALDHARADAGRLGERMLHAWLALISALVATGPCVLVLEDLHWGDPQTVRFLDAALRELERAPLFVLALARTDVHDRFPGLWRDRPLQEFRLGALAPKACARLVREILPDIGETALDRIVQHSEGNAFFLEEMIRASVAGGAPAPTSVVAMVQARLDALDTQTRRVVRAASVFGEVAQLAGVAAVLGADADDALDAPLGRLLAAELMSRRTSQAGQVEYAFRHALVREAAYAALTDDDRRTAHGAAGRWLESIHERDALLLAGHYDAAALPPDAARCFAEAAHQALERSDFEAALARGRRAIELGGEGETRRRALIAMGRASGCVGLWNDAHRDLEAALAMTVEPGDRIVLLRDVFRANTFRQDAVVLRRVGTEALEIATRLERPELIAESNAAIAVADHCEGRADEAVDGYLTACRASEHSSLVHVLAGIILYHHARFDEAVYWNEKLLQFAIDTRDEQSIANQHANIALAYAGRGDYEVAEEHFAKGRECARRNGLVTFLARTTSLATGWQIDVLDYESARRNADEARGIGAAMQFTTPRVSSLLDLATIAVRQDRPDDAAQILEPLTTVIANGPGFHGWLWRLRNAVLHAEIAAARRQWTGAVELATVAAARCDEYRRAKYAINARLVLARSLAALGRPEEAAPVLERAAAEAQRCGERTWQLRVKLAALACGDRGALADATRLASEIERALPAPRAATFRASRELAAL